MLDAMQLEVSHKRVGDVDALALERIAERLAPLYRGEDAPVWPIVRQRSEWIGRDERPADVGFRKMRPTSYVQLCFVNDESPHSPWALDIANEIMSEGEQRAFARAQHEMLEALYGEGILCFAGLAILGPGGLVPLHRDMPHDHNKKAFTHHLHAPITEADQCEFVLAGEPVILERGGLYEIDNMRPHSATHRGDGYRVNLMLDYCPIANLEQRMAPSLKKSG